MPLIQTCARLLRCQAGVSAVEFSLLAPFMTIGAISTVDAGMAVYDKMMISQVLRAGSHSAIASSSVAEVEAILEATAADNFTVADGAPLPGQLSLDVTQYCVCPDDMATVVVCTDSCDAGANPVQFYDLAANLVFDGVILPTFTLSGEMKVMAQ